MGKTKKKTEPEPTPAEIYIQATVEASEEKAIEEAKVLVEESEDEAVKEEPIKEPEPIPVVKTPEDIVKVKVLFGTVSFTDPIDGEIRTYQGGNTFETTRKRAESLHQRFIQIL